MSSSVNDSNLEKKFQAVTNTQDSIQTLSLWILHHKAHHQKIVGAWMKVLKKAKISHRLTLFYLANDVIQNSRRKGVAQFGESFAEILREATLLVRDEQIRSSVNRVFKIWEERSVYDSDFIADLQGILANAKVPVTAPSKLLAEFKHESVIEKLRTVLKSEVETASKMSTVNLSKLNATNAEIVQQLKDRTHGQQFSCDFDESSRCLEELVKALSKEVKERTELILLLEQSEIYYDTQRGEAKIVANAYKNFSSRVKTLQKKLEELTATFPSPLPSPCPDAPSPTNSDVEAELNLPGDKKQTAELECSENAPSPVGSPEGLVLSPPAAVPKPIGNPIPTLSNFFTQETGGMSSWLDAFSNKKPPTAPISSKKSDPSSLDSRLSNLLQNIPNLPSGLQNTLFGGTTSTPSQDVANSPVTFSRRTESSTVSVSADITTPIKDEYSGQNTPLQDEDTHSSNSAAAFFTRLAANPKTSQSPKDILKGLTNLIQTASTKPTHKTSKFQNKEESWFSEKYEKKSVSDIVKKITPIVSESSQHSGSPAVFFNSPQRATPSPQKENTQSAPISSRTVSNPSHSFQTPSYSDSESLIQSYSSEPASAQSIHENLSFIPTLVPSTPLSGNFDFDSNNFDDEYNPEIENFEIDMDSETELGPLDDTSPERLNERSSADEDASDDKLIESMAAQRQSTLITVVTGNDMQGLEEKDENSIPFTKPNVYNSPPEDLGCETDPKIWPEDAISMKEHDPLVPQQDNLSEDELAVTLNTTDESKNEAFFTTPVSTVSEHDYSNGQGTAVVCPQNSQGDWPLSKIETVQSHRKDMSDNRWFGNDWNDFEGERQDNYHSDERNSYGRRPPVYHDYHHTRGSQQPHFHPRNNWQPRPRHFNDYNHGPPGPKRFAPFTARGRGWKRHQPQY